MEVPRIRIFLSSPADVAEERRLALAVVDRVQGWYRGRVELEAVTWEREPLAADASFQDGIPRASECDVAVVLLWTRLGSPLPRAYARDDGSRPTGTEWEFEDALRGASSERRTRVLVYRCTASPAEAIAAARLDGRRALQEQLEQLDRVDAFFETNFQDAEDETNARAFHAFATPGEFEQRFQSHLTACVEEHLGGSEASLATWRGSPFRGLMAFRAEHARIYFGRARAVTAVRQALRDQTHREAAFVILLGRSGSGKTSLLQAGVLPLLADPGVVDPTVAGGVLRHAVVRPGDASDPLAATGAALCAAAALGAGRVETVTAVLRSGPTAAVAYVEAELDRIAENEGRPVRLLLVVDPLEEIFTRKGRQEGQVSSFAALIEAFARSGRVWVLAAMRSDFYPALMDVPSFVALKQGSGQVDVLPPTPAEIGEMIRQPARAAGLVFEVAQDTNEGLDAALQDAALRSPAALPLLQFTLEQLYEHREGARLTWKAYEALGGIEGAIARRAAEVLDALPADVSRAAPEVLRALVEVGQADTGPATRRRASLAVLTDRPASKRFVDALIDARLLVTDRDADGTAVVSLAHEALTRRMPLLRDLVHRDRALLQARARVTEAAARWQAEQREASLLLPEGKPLDEAIELVSAGWKDLEEPVPAYVEASRRRIFRRRCLVRGALVGVLLLVGGGVLAWRWWTSRAVDVHLDAARSHLAAGDFLDALASVAKAQERDPESARARITKSEFEAARAASEEARRRAAARAAAAEAREEARRLELRIRPVQEEVRVLAVEVKRQQRELGTSYAPTAERAAFARMQRDLGERQAEVARLRESVREALERAARHDAAWGGNSKETDLAFADFYQVRSEESRALGDEERARRLGALALRYDPSRQAAIAGRGSLRLTVAPTSVRRADAFLFRYETYESVRPEPPVVTRLVPVPTSGVGRTHAAFETGTEGTFVPGDLCLEIVGVQPEGPAARAGLVRGDLVVRIDGDACGDGLLLTAVHPGGAAAEAGLRPGERVGEIDGILVEGPRDWTWAPYRRRKRRAATGALERDEGPYHLAVEGKELTAPYDPDPGRAFGLEVAGPEEVAEGAAPAGGLTLTCLRGGALTTLEVPAGEAAGFDVEVTAYPLVLAEGEGGNRISSGVELPVDPGSYLLFVRAPGCEAQRVPFVAPRGEDVTLDVHLRPAGSTPEGFVYVPPGPFVAGGDPATIMGGPREVREGRGFLIARTELTFAAWARFLNDEETRPAVAASLADGTLRWIPRHGPPPRVRDGDFVDGRFVPAMPAAPVTGVSRQDVDAYLAWRNRRADAEGEPWRYDLPTEWEWEQAARGADGRLFPWGDRFDYSLCVGWYRRPRALTPEPPRFEPRDASPHGVNDLAGSVVEVTRDVFPSDSTRYVGKGGAWQYQQPSGFRVVERRGVDPDDYGGNLGVRLVARSRAP